MFNDDDDDLLDLVRRASVTEVLSTGSASVGSSHDHIERLAAERASIRGFGGGGGRGSGGVGGRWRGPHHEPHRMSPDIVHEANRTSTYKRIDFDWLGEVCNGCVGVPSGVAGAFLSLVLGLSFAIASFSSAISAHG